MATVKTAWITGVTGNLGWALAQAFLAEGYFVHGFARKWKNDLAVPEGNFKFWPIDLQNATKTQAVATKLQLEYAVPDVVVMAAGTFKPGDWSAWTAEELHQMIQRHVDTAVNIIQPIFPSILEKGSGRVFFIGAKPGLDIKLGKQSISYALSKSLLFQLSTLMNEISKGKNIVSTVIVPSIIDTPDNRQAMPQADFSKWVKLSSIVNAIVYHSKSENEELHTDIIKAYHLS